MYIESSYRRMLYESGNTVHAWIFQGQIVLITIVIFTLLLFFYSCPANFTGATCDTDVDECLVLSNPCKNGATCTNFVGGYICRCINGWEGVDCATNTNDCLTLDGSSKCLHGGICVDNVGKFDCHCTPNYTGKLLLALNYTDKLLYTLTNNIALLFAM